MKKQFKGRKFSYTIGCYWNDGEWGKLDPKEKSFHVEFYWSPGRGHVTFQVSLFFFQFGGGRVKRKKPIVRRTKRR